jgi:SAM-dependent methyltransferase
LFVCSGTQVRRDIKEMPGCQQMSVDGIVEECRQLASLGVAGVILFGLPDTKDPRGEAAADPQGPVADALRALRTETPTLSLWADVCLCEYTDHGHCGPLTQGPGGLCEVDNDAALPLLAAAALTYANAGADVVAVDLAPRLVASGRARSEAAGLAVDWRVGDAGSLPLEDAGFDCVASSFGIIHARDTRRVVDELDRVLRPGGVALVTAWASAGLMGRVLRLAAEVEGRGPGDARPEWWGRYEGVQLAFSRFAGFEARDLTLRWRFESADQLWDELAAPPGPLAGAAARGEGARERLMQLVEPFARREEGHLVLDVGYLMVVAHKPEWAAGA